MLDGVGLLSLSFGLTLLALFRNKSFGVLDPLSLLLVLRIAPMIASMMILTVTHGATFYTVLLILSGSTFLIALFLSTPRQTPLHMKISSGEINNISNIAILIISLKIIIWALADGTLPVFSAGGSDAYIEYDENNKITSAFGLALKNVDIILFAFIFPLTKRGLRRKFICTLLICSMLMAVFTGKKAAMLGVITAIAFGEYLRLNLLEDQKRYFISKINLMLGSTIAVIWAVLIFAENAANYRSLFEVIDPLAVLDYVYYQWSSVFKLFGTGELVQFFDRYEVNRYLYFFHTLLVPIGFSAFASSPGPAIHGFLTGSVTGNGVNPTFIVEGFILFDIFLPLYAFIIGLLLGVVRRLIYTSRGLRAKVIRSAFFLPVLYGLPIDSLAFFKSIWVLLIVIIFYFFIKRFKYCASKGYAD